MGFTITFLKLKTRYLVRICERKKKVLWKCCSNCSSNCSPLRSSPGNHGSSFGCVPRVSVSFLKGRCHLALFLPHREGPVCLAASIRFMLVCVHVCSVVSDSFVTPWAIAHQASLSMGFSRQEYWSGLSFPSPRIFPIQGLHLHLLDWQANSFLLHHLLAWASLYLPRKKETKVLPLVKGSLQSPY